MAMGKRKSEQTPGHPFYACLNTILDEAGFDRFVEDQCRSFLRAADGPRRGRYVGLPRPAVNCGYDALPTRSATFNSERECAGLTDDDLRVEVPSDQRRSGQVGTESCEPGGDVRFEA